MTKKEIEKEINSLLYILTTGNREQVRNAKKELDKLWHRDNKLFKGTYPVVFEYLSGFDQIRKVENQAALASGLSLFFLVFGDKYFDILVDFTLKVIQHPNGSVREAIRHSADWLYILLTSRAEPFVYPKGKKLTEEQKTMQTQAQIQYIKFVQEIEFLIDKYDEGNGEDRYIDDMKPSINKSLQLLWSRLTDSCVYRRILEKIRPLPSEITVRKEEIENELRQMLKKTRSFASLEDIKDIIYHEDGQDSLTDVIAMFDNGQGLYELENVLEIVNEAWNYFPHKILNGLSPAEKVLEYQRAQWKAQKLLN